MSTSGQYSRWVELLDRFAAGEDDALAALEVETIDCTPVVTERLTLRVNEAFVARVTALQKQFQQDMTFCATDIRRVAPALIALRTRLAPLARLTRLPALPEPVQIYLRTELERFVGEVQAALERSAGANPALKSDLRQIIKQHPLRLPDVVSAHPEPPARPGTMPRRPIILTENPHA